jgi:transposase
VKTVSSETMMHDAWDSSDSDEEFDEPRVGGHVIKETIRWAIIGALRTMFNTTKPQALAHGAQSLVAKQFGVTQGFVSKLWKRFSNQVQAGQLPDLAPNLAERGRKVKLNDFLILQIKAVVHHHPDAPLRALCHFLEAEHEILMAKSTLFRYLNLMGCTVKNSRVKPTLTAKHLRTRLTWVLDKIENGQFNDELTTIHVDEKWFYVTRTKRKIRLFPGETVREMKPPTTRPT